LTSIRGNRGVSFCVLLAILAFFSGNARSAHGQTSNPAPSDRADGGSSTPVEKSSDSKDFFRRLGKAYWDDWTGASGDSPDLPRRGDPAPVSSPPFPFSDWPYGGSPTIGAPDTNGGPLMTAIYDGKHGKGWEDSRIKLYGWINGGFNVSTSDKHYGNAPAAYYLQPNSVQLDQAAV
jgi:hypothetical protein